MSKNLPLGISLGFVPSLSHIGSDLIEGFGIIVFHRLIFIIPNSRWPILPLPVLRPPTFHPGNGLAMILLVTSPLVFLIWYMI